ncbi:HEPN domain-containing protein [Serratia marcescens]|uniref:HEPN domain-containing protein n=1 Tax=Serratia TaxID=613 RepID=UPI001C2C4130|nr:HEPN domain-containing protein [Serratia liquefaciens]MBV0843718.1 hypothetical protein [Serratia liquefaciens]
MSNEFLGELFGVPFFRPTNFDSIIQLVDIFPELIWKQTEKGDKTITEASNNIIVEVYSFAEQLPEPESSIFITLFESELTKREEAFSEEYIMDPNKLRWGFYIRFKISEPLGSDLNTLHFFDKYTIEADENQTLKNAKTLVFKTSEFLTYKEAFIASKKIEQSLILAFSELGIGITYPKNLASESEFEKIRTTIEDKFFTEHTTIYDTHYERPLIHFSDKYGIVMFQEKSIPFDSKYSEEKEPADTNKLHDSFIKHYNQLNSHSISDYSFKKLEVATSIFTTSIFEDSLINKIILSMTVIEVLSNKTRKSDEEQKGIDHLVTAVNTNNDIDENIKKKLIQTLDFARTESIGKSCKILVKELLEGKDAKLFHKLYEYRSQLVHAGTLKDNKEEMYKIYSDSYSLTKRLLIAYLNQLNNSNQ